MLEGASIVVCGASQGIGKATCDLVLNLGANLIQVARDENALLLNAQSWVNQFPKQEVSSLALDMTLDSSAESLSDLLTNRGPIDGLVVTIGSGAPTNGAFISRLRASLDSNVISATNAVFGCMEYFRSTSRSSVVLVSSIAGHEVIPCPPEYAASKAALEMLTKHWSALHTPIRFNVVAPGNIHTDNSVWSRRFEEDREGLMTDLGKSVPLGRLGKPEEVAEVIAFLLSQQSSFMTGSVVTVDGGQQRSLR